MRITPGLPQRQATTKETFDESHQVSATAAAKVADVSEMVDRTDKIYASVGSVSPVGGRFP